MTIVTQVFLWFYNKKRFQEFKHQIPADVVRQYLDSIIYSSQSLKDSLFRGEVPGLPAGAGETRVIEKIKEVPADDSKLAAELEKIKNELANKSGEVSKLGVSLEGSEQKVKSSEVKIAELEAKIQELMNATPAQASGDGSEPNAAMQAQLDEISKEKDMLRERLQEYEIIEDDLANLKRLQQENEQLKNSLKEAKGEEVAAAPEQEDEHHAEAPQEEAEEGAEVTELKAEVHEEPVETADEPDTSSDPDDLLREFEKMLG